jgi:predicted  nucleic acid-binding Zn-ribbon protein
MGLASGEAKRLRRDLDNEVEAVFDRLAALDMEVDDLKDKLREAEKNLTDVMSALREAAQDPMNDVPTANHMLDAAEGAV